MGTSREWEPSDMKVIEERYLEALRKKIDRLRDKWRLGQDAPLSAAVHLGWMSREEYNEIMRHFSLWEEEQRRLSKWER